ncbi:hypothetical protein WN943_006810 [Citrus x changshan-huyou]
MIESGLYRRIKYLIMVGDNIVILRIFAKHMVLTRWHWLSGIHVEARVSRFCLLRGRDDNLARIKKIMQADEDVGKIALAVPVLVSKALELFFQDLCDRTYEITLQRGAKTMSSLHL